MSSIVPIIFVWFVTLFSACIGIVIAGTIGAIVGAITNLITQYKCTMRIFNVAMLISLVSTVLFIIIFNQKIQPLNCADGIEGLYICFSPLLIPFWGAIIGGIFGSFIGVVVEIYTRSSR
ncbi:MAG: hypothetical protein QNJ68_00960 [Microcoleaceae cyanobacterium MO_207.B10]|nr:hypothetical protein [Microcoleaceae cyanobacterium MO_207.B10]